MEQKIAELTEKIFQEGVQKGQEKVDAMLQEARDQADRIIADARTLADKTVADARRQADDIRKVTDKEIKLAGDKAIAALKQQITALVMAKVIDDSASAVLTDPERMAGFIAEMVKNWRAGAEAVSLEVLLPESKKDELQKALSRSASDLLKKGLDVRFASGIRGGFRIGPSGSQYKISMTDEDFKEFFKEYLKPKTRTYLFGE